MEQSRSSQLLLGLKRYGAVAGAALLTAVAPFNSSAHVHGDNPVSRSLKGYEGFVNQMHRMNPDGSVGQMSCCHLKDGVGNIKEEFEDVKDATAPKGTRRVYYVTFTHNVDGTPLPKPTRVRVPDEAVMTDKYAVQFCKNLKAEVASGKVEGWSDADKAQRVKDAATCERPPTNIAWIAGFQTDVNEKIRTNEKGEAILQQYQFYCYIPKPQTQ